MDPGENKRSELDLGQAKHPPLHIVRHAHNEMYAKLLEKVKKDTPVFNKLVPRQK